MSLIFSLINILPILRSSSSALIISALAALLFFFHIIRRPRYNKRLPPGPWGFPLIGYLPFMDSAAFKTFTRLSKKYGKLFRLHLMGRDYYVINDYELAKEAFVTNGDNFSGRSQEFSYFMHALPNGLDVAEGGVHKSHRKYWMNTVVATGIGNGKIEDRLQEIGDNLIEFVENTNGEAYDFRKILGFCSFNAVSHVLYGKNYSIKDEQFHKIFENIHAFERCREGKLGFIVGPFFKMLKGHRLNKNFRDLEAVTKEMNKVSEEVVQERMDILNKTEGWQDNVDNYVDGFVKLIQEDQDIPELNNNSLANGRRRSLILNEHFTYESLKDNIQTLFLAGTDTTSNAIYYSINYMAKYPEVQAKVQNEIDQAIGRNRSPHLSDRILLPYTMAVIEECLRHAAESPLTLVTVNHDEAYIGGYYIPQRSNCMLNLYLMSRDPRYFVNPNHFDPRNFLDKNGKFQKVDAQAPFSMGRRKCLGETLARNEIFLFFSRLMQNFNWKAPEGEELRSDVEESLVRVLMPYKVRAIPREIVQN